jgi:hypothetical protein
MRPSLGQTPHSPLSSSAILHDLQHSSKRQRSCSQVRLSLFGRKTQASSGNGAHVRGTKPVELVLVLVVVGVVLVVVWVVLVLVDVPVVVVVSAAVEAVAVSAAVEVVVVSAAVEVAPQLSNSMVIRAFCSSFPVEDVVSPPDDGGGSEPPLA